MTQTRTPQVVIDVKEQVGLQNVKYFKSHLTLHRLLKKKDKNNHQTSNT